MTRSLTQYERYKHDKEAALDYAFTSQRKWCDPVDRAFMWTSTMGTDGTRYGSFKHISRTQLEGRTYDIEFWDGAVSLFFTDVLFEPSSRSYILKTAALAV